MNWKNLVTTSAVTQLTRSGAAVKLYNSSTDNMLNFNPALNFINTDLNNAGANILGPTPAGFHFIIIARPKTSYWGKTSSRAALMGNGGSGNEPAFDFEKATNAPNGIRIWTGCSAITNSTDNGTTIYSGYGAGVGSNPTHVNNQPAAWSSALQNFQTQVFGLGISRMVSGCSATDTLKTYTDGYKKVSTAKLINTSADDNGLYIGSSGSERYPNLDVAEFIIFNKELTGDELMKVESYVAIKYGITLGQGNNSIGNYNIGKNAANYNYIASDGSVFWNNAKAGSYINNIAGIGIDYASALNQKQSKSVNWNRSGQVVISLGTTVAATNNANTNSFSNDRSFLMWGDNSENTNDNTVSDRLQTAYATFTYANRSDLRRLKRVWQAQNSGVNQPVRVQFPVDNVGTTEFASETVCAKYVLISSTDPTFNSNVTIVPLATVGSNYEATITYPAGVSYFTFGKADNIVEGIVNLPAVSRPTVNLVSPCTQDAFTYYYATDDAGRERKLFAINWNGNTPVAGISGNIDYSTSAHSVTTGSNTTNIMGRILGITPAGGNFVNNGGIILRLYYSPAELTASIVPGAGSQNWFKTPLTPSGVIASNNGTTINAAAFTPSATGTEDGVHYVEFSNINSFSSFGYVSQRILSILPAQNLRITEAKETEKCTITLQWAADVQKANGTFTIEHSKDGNTFLSIAKQNAASTQRQYQYHHNIGAYTSNTNFYRIKYTDVNATVSYSKIAIVKNACSSKAFSLAPNPVKNEINITNLGEGKKNLSVFSIDGRLIYTATSSTTLHIVDASKWSAGIYSVIVDYSDNTRSVKKIIKE